ncbi:unnamed protein product [Thlaspi arvense]|uniref:DC1 domain-containing protein n=1 Tax=Thlaspi arvense TaxID=13288 RepID=A0AAU9RM87_THLAR|nr:unnamed protein product [Thlaspi arvense]
MDLVGEFHKVEIDGKSHLLYYNVKYPLPQIYSTNSSGKTATDSGENLLQPLFVCPTVRVESASQTATPTYVLVYKFGEPKCELFSKIETSPLFDDNSKDHHHVLPLFRCNNKEASPEGECHACRVQTLVTDYYFCVECDKRVYDETKYCQACSIPIYEESFYVCMEECYFFLHETCANAPRKMLHPLHPHTLKLETVITREGIFRCSLCIRMSSGFLYRCTKRDCDYKLDVRCALVSEPFEYQGHQHPLFLALDPKEKPMCHVCKTTEHMKVLNCIECDFIICFKCATLPYMVKYKHDEHYLTFCHGDEASDDSDWCELCEGKLAIGGKAGFYKCNECCTTIHIHCLLWDQPYMKPVPTIQFGEDTIDLINDLES